MANINSTSREALNGADIYYGRLLEFFKAVGEFNEVRGIYDKLDQLRYGEWVPPAVESVYKNTYKSNPANVRKVYQERDGRVTRLLGYIKEALQVLHIDCPQGELENFEMMARGTLGETSFRTKVSRHVETLRSQLGREIMRRLNGEPPKPTSIETPSDLIGWYQTPRGRKKK